MTVSVHHAQIARVLRAVGIVDDATVTLSGRPLAVDALRAGAGGPAQPPLVKALTQLIYTELYLRRHPARPGLSDRGLLAALCDANRTVVGWDAGWELVAIQGDTHVVMKDGVRVHATTDDLASASGTPRAVGERVHLRIGKDRRAYSPGYYYVHGDALEDGDAWPTQLVRVYFHLELAGATPFVDAVTTVLNDAAIPFRAKVASSAMGFCRADAGVLYLGQARYLKNLAALAAVAARLRPHLRPETPLFTKRVAAGIAVAEDPGNGESFGEHRSRALATALAQAHAASTTSRDERLALALTELRANGIDAARPYLNAGNPDPYDAWS